MKQKFEISTEILDRYVAGKATLEEIALVTMAVRQDDSIRETISILEEMRRDGTYPDNEDIIPMASMAALSEGNLCDVMCEQYILKDFIGESALDEFVDDALDNCWLKESGTPLHNMGRILEKNGMAVSRTYNCSASDIESHLSSREKIITVVDYGQLSKGESDGIFHAVVCLSIIDDIIRIYDPAINGHSNYEISDFVRAWNYSSNYMVCASSDRLKYNPHPIDVNGINLDDDLLELSEAIAENAHEIWAKRRQDEGWHYGPERNDKLLENPDMVPYSELPEGEKYYDRDMALNTIRLVKKLGFSIHRRYTLYCPHCGEYVSQRMNFCPNCGKTLTMH